MLLSLSVENYALIDRLEMTLGPGLNIITGETGAGKSILLGALGLLLGTRSESGVQRDVGRACVVEGVFSVEGYGLEGFFADNDLDFEPTVTVRRVISASGKSRAYVGDLPVGLAVLRALGDRLIDIHSQHENLLLLGDAFRVSTLDAAASQGGLVKNYAERFAAWRALQKELAAARAAAATAAADHEWLRHQVAELSGLRLTAGEQAALEAEQRELSHSDELREAFTLVAAELGADDIGIGARLRALRGTLDRVGSIHPGAALWAERLASAHIELTDLEREVADACERVEGNPERLAKVVARLDAIGALQLKHRAGSVDELLTLQEEFTARLAAIEHGDERVARLEAEVGAAEAETRSLAEAISAGRRAAAPEVEKTVGALLRRLGMPEARFVVEIAPSESLRPTGGDQVLFLFTANGSMAPRPIEKIASGGEISRVMLALKTLLARSAGQPTVIFDEIDAGVSGRVADAMGEVIADLSAHCQVVNITHLPQIAAGPGTHFLVYKHEGATHIKTLTPAERVNEIAAMLSASTVTEAALRQARELLS